MLNIISSSRYSVNRKLIKSEVDTVLSSYQFAGDETLNIVFVGKKKMKEIASSYKGENIALPVLSFSYLDEPHGEEKLIGEIFICYPQAVLLAAERGKKVDNIILFLVKHGIENIIK